MQEKDRQNTYNIIFIIIFFILLFIPVLHIDKKDVSDVENRKLAAWHSLINKNNTININFGNEFDSWFNDRFFLRNYLIKLNSNIFFNKMDSKVVFGKDNWFFYKEDNSIRNYQNLDLFNSQELKAITEFLQDINNYCKKNNKKFYFFITPDKNKIYGEYYPNYIKKHIPDSQSRTFQLINHLKTNTDINIIFPYEELKKEKNKNLLYTKTDTHWNTYGAYIGYRTLIQRIAKDTAGITPIDIDKIYSINLPSGDITKLLPETIKIFDDTLYSSVYTNISYSTIEAEPPEDSRLEDEISLIITKKQIDTPKLLMYRDSFTTNLIPYISNTFSSVKYIWGYSVQTSEIDKADIIILEIIERFIPEHLTKRQLQTTKGEFNAV